MRSRHLFVALALLLAFSGCGGDNAEPGPTAPRATTTFGEELFNERVVGVNPGCVTCHSLQPGVTLVGPSLAAVRSPVAGLSDAEYIRASILDPDGYLVPGYSAGQMSSGWEQYLTPEQIDSLVAYLLDQG
ncbi:MAG: c-type cytochrome [Acidimicrobiia bacterium]|nr:c-type cytochrome [Acidimicrobiia bacterium]